MKKLIVLLCMVFMVMGLPAVSSLTHTGSGDIAECYADPSYAKQELNFTCTKTLEDMVRDSYQYRVKNRK